MARKPGIDVRDDDIVVVGSGIAGLVCALSLAPRPVTLITKTADLPGGSSRLAKGGIAAAVGAGDSPEQHASDTLAAGAGLSDPERAIGLARHGVEDLQMLIEAGVPFDRALDGSLQLAREAAHGRSRVVHAGGDATGDLLVSTLAERVRSTPSIDILTDTFAADLAVDRGRVTGVLALHAGHDWVLHRTSRVVLATGGIGMTWWHTTNPAEATGDGLAVAARAGVVLADLEFMQFHPTALAVANDDGASLPLLTEALRGAGATLLDASGQRFMLREAPEAELAPRDVVARAIHARTSSGERVYLDLRPVIASGAADEFPRAIEAAREAGFDPTREPVPIVPAAHYHMGGVQVDEVGRSSIEGLWACGEVATSGVHGANRLASNSLLEGLVYARQVARDVAACRQEPRNAGGEPPMPPEVPALSAEQIAGLCDELRQVMSRHVGISRSRQGLETALAELVCIEHKLEKGAGRSVVAAVDYLQICNLLTVARLVALAALGRDESRGAHYRSDFPQSRDEWCRRQQFTLESLENSRL